jgi:hypothetical protein
VHDQKNSNEKVHYRVELDAGSSIPMHALHDISKSPRGMLDPLHYPG